MDINCRQRGRKWIVEVWCEDVVDEHIDNFKKPYPEETYTNINDWCKNTLGYHARTAYHIFEFKKRSDLDWFLLRWN